MFGNRMNLLVINLFVYENCFISLCVHFVRQLLCWSSCWQDSLFLDGKENGYRFVHFTQN